MLSSWEALLPKLKSLLFTNFSLPEGALCCQAPSWPRINEVGFFPKVQIVGFAEGTGPSKADAARRR
jgi:hypothetical protein